MFHRDWFMIGFIGTLISTWIYTNQYFNKAGDKNGNIFFFVQSGTRLKHLSEKPKGKNRGRIISDSQEILAHVNSNENKIWNTWPRDKDEKNSNKTSNILTRFFLISFYYRWKQKISSYLQKIWCYLKRLKGYRRHDH